MKRYLLFILFFVSSAAFVTAQTFDDDFESYSVGDYVGQESSEWTTWSGTTGGAEDARVTDAEASSGSNSIYFSGGPGPQDVVLPFGGKRTSGKFTYSMNMLIPQGKAGYFNFQGEVTIGSTWTMNTYLNSDGTFSVDDASFIRFSGDYPQGEWFNITFEVNLTANIWKVTFDGECLGSYAAENNSLASIDLFPATASDEFYVDDVSYTYDPNAEIPALDAGVFSAVADLSGLAGSDKEIAGALVNNGTDAITSFTVDYSIGANSGSQSYTGLNIARGEVYGFIIDEVLTLDNGTSTVNLTLTELNGTAGDEDDCNNSTDIVFTGFTPAVGRKVYVEEGTGTWCPWCPRGDVFMNRMEEKYHDNFVGVAVHNGDPMVVDEWDNGVGTFNGFTGYPGVIVGRTLVTDPSTMESDIISRVQVEPSVIFVHGASFDEATRELQVSITTNVLKELSGNNRLIVGLTEDGVTGTGSGYNQANNYAGGGSGVMGGYELLGNPVPASQMVYNHVGRALFTPFNGLANAYGSETVLVGEERTHGYSFTVPQSWDIENVNIISAMRNIFGQIDNAQKTTVRDAETNGLSTGTYDIALDAETEIYPNPFSDIANIRIKLDSPESVKIEVADAMGKIVAVKNYGQIAGDQVFQFNGSDLQSGVYYIRLFSGEKFATKKVVIAR